MPSIDLVSDIAERLRWETNWTLIFWRLGYPCYAKLLNLERTVTFLLRFDMLRRLPGERVRSISPGQDAGIGERRPEPCARIRFRRNKAGPALHDAVALGGKGKTGADEQW